MTVLTRKYDLILVAYDLGMCQTSSATDEMVGVSVMRYDAVDT